MPIEKHGVQKITADSVPTKSAHVLWQEFFPIAKNPENGLPTADEKAALKAGMSKATVTAVDLRGELHILVEQAGRELLCAQAVQNCRI